MHRQNNFPALTETVIKIACLKLLKDYNRKILKLLIKMC